MTGRGCDRLGEGGLQWGWGILRAVGNVLPNQEICNRKNKRRNEKRKRGLLSGREVLGGCMVQWAPATSSDQTCSRSSSIRSSRSSSSRIILIVIIIVIRIRITRTELLINNQINISGMQMTNLEKSEDKKDTMRQNTH